MFTATCQPVSRAAEEPSEIQTLAPPPAITIGLFGFRITEAQLSEEAANEAGEEGGGGGGGACKKRVVRADKHPVKGFGMFC